MTFYWIQWLTRTTNGQLRQYYRSVKDMQDGRTQAAKLQQRANVLDLWVKADHDRTVIGERFRTVGELARM